MKNASTFYSILIVNLIPVIGVLWFNWQVFDMFWLFWLEMLILSFFDTIRVLYSQEGRIEGKLKLNYFPALRFLLLRLFIFCFYSIFIIVFIGIIGKSTPVKNVFKTLLFLDLVFNLSVILIILAHVNYLIKDFFVTKKYVHSYINQYVPIFDSRQLFMHIAVVVCAMISTYFSSRENATLFVILFFCLLKFAFTYYYEKKESLKQQYND